MANTAIIDLAKPAGTDHALISVINSNMDKIDAEAGRQRGNFAGTYSTTSGYAVGDYCIYQGNLYRCTTAIGSSGENWTAAHWTQTKAGTELKGLSDQMAKEVVTSGTSAVRNLSSYTAKTLIDECVTRGYKFYYCSCTGGQKLSDLPIIQAGVYVIYCDTVYKTLYFYGTDGTQYQYVYDAGWYNRMGEVQLPGTWNGNQTIATLQSNVTQTGMTHAYMADSLISGWAMIVAYVSSTYKYIEIIGSSKFVFTRTSDGSTWTTSSMALT